MPPPLVWSEREGGDWEACVISSYLIGLVYGGLHSFPLGIYTQAEREALEQVADEPQDYHTTDATSQARYGVQLRKLSTGGIDDAVTRVGIGLVAAGYGGLLIPTTAPIHSVFYLPTSQTAGLLFDPLAANQSAGVPIDASRIVAWSKGAGPNDAREVKENEFAMATDVQVRAYPTPRTWLTKGGVLVGRRLDPAPLTMSGTFLGGSPALASAEYTIAPTPAGWPAGPYQLVMNGAMAGYLVANSDITLPDPVWPLPPTPTPTPPPAGVTEAEVEAIVKAAVDPVAADVADLDRRLHRFEDIQ